MSGETQVVVSGETGSDANVATQGAAPASVSTDAAVSSNETKEQEVQQKERTFSQAELDAAVARRLAKERRRFEREMRGMIESREQPHAVKKPDEPKRGDFQDDESYLEARTSWIAKNKADEYLQEAMSKAHQAQAADAQKQAAWDVVEKGREAYKDFDAVVNAAFEEGLIEPGSALHMAIIEDEEGHKLAYHLSKNPDEAIRIGRLSAQRQLIELGRMSAKLNEKPVSKAPTPPVPVTNAGSADTDWMSRTPEQILKDRAKERRLR